jgi:hypothetical protein
MRQKLQKSSAAALIIFVWFLLSPAVTATAAPLNQLWTRGEFDGAPYGAAMVDADKDGIKDILCLKYDYSTPGT